MEALAGEIVQGRLTWRVGALLGEVTQGALIWRGADEAKGPAEKRPYLATECHDVVEADRWRGQVIRDIGRQVMAIQNAGLGEHKCGPLPSPVSDAEQCAARRADTPRPRYRVQGRCKH